MLSRVGSNFSKLWEAQKEGVKINNLDHINVNKQTK